MSPIGMHFVSEAIITIACISAALAIFWYIRNRHGLNAQMRRAGYLLFMCLLCCGLSRLTDVLALIVPSASVLDFIDAFLVSASLVSGIAVWPLLPELARLPSSTELQIANARLAAKEQASLVLMRKLTEANRELEERVARRTAELLHANRRFEAALEGSNITVSQQDGELRYIWAYNLPNGLEPEALIGRRTDHRVFTSDGHSLAETKQYVLRSGQPAHVEFSIAIGDQKRWFEQRVEPVADGGAIVGVMSTAVDITPRKRHEIELVGLLHELTHRSKNLLAVIQGIARQTGQTSASIAEFNRRFAARLQALSLAHELLVTSSWRGVDLQALVEGVLRNVAPDRLPDVVVRGPSIHVTPEAAQSLVIGLHEMTANAVSHGALASTDGTLQIEWNEEENLETPRLAFIWLERGAPRAIAAKPRGFGFAFVENLLPRAVGGQSVLTFADDGLTWRLSFPTPPTGA